MQPNIPDIILNFKLKILKMQQNIFPDKMRQIKMGWEELNPFSIAVANLKPRISYSGEKGSKDEKEDDGDKGSVNILDLPPPGRSSLVSLWLPLLGRHSVRGGGDHVRQQQWSSLSDLVDWNSQPSETPTVHSCSKSRIHYLMFSLDDNETNDERWLFIRTVTMTTLLWRQ